MHASPTSGNRTPGLAASVQSQADADSFRVRMNNGFQSIAHLDAGEVLVRILVAACYRASFNDLKAFIDHPHQIGQIPNAIQNLFKAVQKQVKPVTDIDDPCKSTSEVFSRAVAFLSVCGENLPALAQEIADVFHAKTGKTI